jgi:hypothetical protein
MPKINRFEEIECWRKARELTRSIYSISLEGRFSKDFALRDQLRRAAISILSNIAVVRSNQIPKTVRVGRQKIYLVSELHFGT